MNKEKQTHPSYGMISISRFQGGENTYFGSSIKHNGGISLTIHKAEIDRDLNQDWFYPTGIIAEVRMSYNQFAEAITHLNTSGTPVTIHYTEKDGLIKADEFTTKRMQFENEFKKDMEGLNRKMSSLITDTKVLLSQSKPLTKAEKETILNQITTLERELGSNIPFVASQFNEQMDKTVTEAKAEIEGFYEGKIRSLGIESLQGQIKIPEIENKE
jgi:hypothetical protein